MLKVSKTCSSSEEWSIPKPHRVLGLDDYLFCLVLKTLIFVLLLPGAGAIPAGRSTLEETDVVPLCKHARAMFGHIDEKRVVTASGV